MQKPHSCSISKDGLCRHCCGPITVSPSTARPWVMMQSSAGSRFQSRPCNCRAGLLRRAGCRPVPVEPVEQIEADGRRSRQFRDRRAAGNAKGAHRAALGDGHQPICELALGRTIQMLPARLSPPLLARTRGALGHTRVIADCYRLKISASPDLWSSEKKRQNAALRPSFAAEHTWPNPPMMGDCRFGRLISSIPAIGIAYDVRAVPAGTSRHQREPFVARANCLWRVWAESLPRPSCPSDPDLRARQRCAKNQQPDLETPTMSPSVQLAVKPSATPTLAEFHARLDATATAGRTGPREAEHRAI